MFCANTNTRFDCVRQCAYCRAYQNNEWALPLYPVPAIPLQVKYDYIGCVNIDDVTDPDDPVIVYMYDSWDQREVT